jgi:hypothetical protein
MESEIDHAEIRILGIAWTGWRRNFQRRFARGSEKMSPLSFEVREPRP